ncbi:MAG: sulfatase [Planctomycetaceae bacterium]|nr:sulfatase [Planctomycetaceae bacterium]
MRLSPFRNHSIRCLTALLIGMVVACRQSARADAPRLNVLFIAIDDLGNVLGRTRPPGLKTPHLDALAERGTFFERAYCQIPLCNPSRASVLTGRRPDATTVWDLDRHFREQLPEVVTLPQRFRQQGYHAARVGKIYHYDVPRGIGTSGLDDEASWDQVVNPKGRDVDDELQITNPTPLRPVSAAMCWLAADGNDEEQTDGMIATAAIDLLAQLRDRPFFLGVGFFRPHTPYVAPRKYFDMYPLETIPLPDVPADDRDDIPPAAIPHNIPLPDYGIGEEDLKHSLQAYLASVSFVDAQIGRVLDALDRLNLTNTTLVVLWSDHGYHLGEHHLWQKRTLYDPSARAPVIIAVPGAKSRGVACQRVVEFIDLYPTTVDIALGDVPNNVDGRSLRPLLDDPQAEWDGVACTQILRPGNDSPIMGRSITSDRWRYIEWSAGADGRELYDQQSDPGELHNVAENPAHADVIQRLRKQMRPRALGTTPATPFNRARL